MAGRRKKGLSPDDRAVWQKTIEQAEPMWTPSTAPMIEVFAAPNKPIQKTIAAPINPFRVGESAKPRKSGHKLVPSLAEQFAKTSPNMDKRNFDRLKKGKMAIDGKIDLHGMTIAQAHPALIGFVRSSHASGKRMLLVITGKGKSSRDEGVMPVRRGILKHNVPQWLKSEAIAQQVLQVTQAQNRHGGDGAYYVYLRRTR